MNILSLFDGISAGQVAMRQLGLPINNYYASEIDKWAIKITQKNHPDTIQLGDVCNWEDWYFQEPIDLLIGGSPCQGFSFAGKQLNFDDPRSALFFEFVNVLHDVKPKYFFLENVRMKQEYQDIISEQLGVKPVVFNSNLVSAQNRHRLYWTNIPILGELEDRKIYLQNILELPGRGVIKSHGEWKSRDIKSQCLDANYHKGVDNHGQRSMIMDEQGVHRKLTPLECERLQTFPDGYTEGVSNTQRYKALGNSWTVEIIKHIFRSME
ncbi:MAG: hypothetical protein GY707_05680 [Desulfobacteraceae bacterium]|nr:hypothetical protein [Desulfobacteraceae bacterium]